MTITLAEIKDELTPAMAELHEVVGSDMLVKIMERFGGQELYVQQLPTSLIVRLYCDGSPESVRALSRRYGRTTKTLYAALRRKTTATTIISLFDEQKKD
jgi:Mor family transcriptional regulator